MELFNYFQSLIDQDKSAVVICNLQHQIIYMNPAAVARYKSQGGAELLGKNLMLCHNKDSQKRIEEVIAWFQESREHNIIYTFYNPKENKDVYMVALRSQDGSVIGYYEKHEYRNRESGKFYDFL